MSGTDGIARSDRRGFFRLVAGALAFALGGAAQEEARATALGIHRATRNTRRALGARVRRLRGPLPPFKSYKAVPRVMFPSAPEAPGRPLVEAIREAVAPLAPGAISLAELARVLELTNGVTGERRRAVGNLKLRAAPSAGALYAGEVYLVARDVRGLEQGIYYYAVLERRLATLETGDRSAAVVAALEQAEGIGEAAAWLLVTNVFERYGWKYADRGYRYALIDTGHIGENLRLASASAGLASARVPRFHDDRLNSLLRVDGSKEAVCAVYGLGRRGRVAPSAAPRIAQRFREQQDVPGYHPAGEGGAPGRYHESTKLVPNETGSVVFPPPLPVSSGGRGGIPLPPPSASAAVTLDEAVHVRRSARHFLRDPITLAQLGHVLSLAAGDAGANGIHLYVVVHRVADLAPGLYRYEPGHELRLLRAQQLARPLVRVCLGQDKAGSAAVGCLMVGRIAEVAALGGARSYRDLLIESGRVGQRIYLAAEASGLAARNLAGYVDDDLNELVGLDGRREAVVHLAMLGPGD